uniref:Uncharacterized protein n=1 Tax=Dunaliella tertiolecta TaxID=3047 RepID=A0A7S3RAD1_DUNTE
MHSALATASPHLNFLLLPPHSTTATALPCAPIRSSPVQSQHLQAQGSNAPFLCCKAGIASRRARSCKQARMQMHALRGGLQVSGLCFDAACQQQADKAFLIALVLPLVFGGLAILYILRPPPKEALEKGSVFRDPKTGAFFEAPEGESPLKDQKGELAFRPISYLPWPVPEDYEGTRLRVAVGERSSKEMRTFVFNKLRPDGELLLVTLPRPLGIVFEYDERRKQAIVVDLVEGSYADQRRKVAGLNQRLQECVLPGDVLRAVSCTNFVYPTNALFGAKAPERHIVLYGADKQKWSSIRGALKKGDVKDGEVSLVVERRRT